MLHYFHDLGRRALDDWSHGLTAIIGVGVGGMMLTAIETAGKVGGIAAIVVGITCSVRREIRESRAEKARASR